MFPTIYGVALKGLGPATKFGAAGLVMAIVGGAIMPLVQGALVDATSAAISFIVPAACFVVVGLYAIYDLKASADVRTTTAPTLAGSPTGCGMNLASRPVRRARHGAARRCLLADAPTSATQDTKQLEVVSWWTSGSEAAALDALLSAFRRVNPDVRAGQRRGRGWRRVPGHRGAGQAAAAGRPARRLADLRRPVGAGLRRPRRRPRRHVDPRRRPAHHDAADDPAVADARRQAVRRPDRCTPQQRAVVQHRAAQEGRGHAAGRRLHSPRLPGRPAEGQGIRGHCPCASAARTRSPPSSCSRTRCSARSATAGWRDMASDALDWRSARVQTALRDLRRHAGLRRSRGQRTDLGRGDQEAHGRRAAPSSP